MKISKKTKKVPLDPLAVPLANYPWSGRTSPVQPIPPAAPLTGISLATLATASALRTARSNRYSE